MGKNKKVRRFKDGHCFERRLLGCSFKADKLKYMPYWKAVRLVEKANGTAKLKRPFLNKLRFEIAQSLGVNEKEVKVCSAVGSSLDIFHGVDCLIIWCCGENIKRIATIDLTLCPSKKKKKKANFIVGPRKVADIVGLSREIAVFLRGSPDILWT